MEMEERQEELKAAMADPESYDRADSVRDLSEQYQALESDLASLYDAWERLTEHVMALED
jgi:ATP-binding cassette subfamily F protein 3